MNFTVNEYQQEVNSNKLLTELYNLYSSKLFLYTRKNYGIGEDDAWTIVYKTIYKIADVHHKYIFENQQKESAFVFKTHINFLRNYFRDNKSFEGRNFEIDLNDTFIQEEKETGETESLHLKLLQTQLDQLEEWERILLLMRGQDMPYCEIAKFINKPERHLKVYYARLKKGLLERINEEIQTLNHKEHEKK